jgi:outer membrane protein assembly factor BamB
VVKPLRGRSGVSLVAVLALASSVSAGSLSGATRAERSTAVQANVDWPDFRFDRANTGHNTAETLVGPTNVTQLQLAWDRDLGAFMTLGSSPVLKDGVLYVAAEARFHGHVFALDPQTGETQWTTALTYAFSLSAPAVAGGIVVVGSGDGNVYALDSATGEVKWTFPTDFGVFTSPTVLHRRVFVSSNDEYLYALSLATGAMVWRRGLGNSAGGASPATVDGLVYAGSEFGHTALALDADTGAKRWSRNLVPESLGSGPVISEGRVFMTTEKGTLLSLDAATGASVWKVTGLGNDLRDPAVADGVVYVGGENNRLTALDAATGAELWATDVDGELFSPIVANGVVYVGGRENKLYAFDAAAGDLLWTAPADGLVTNPILVNGRLYFGSFDNHLYAYALPTSAGQDDG